MRRRRESAGFSRDHGETRAEIHDEDTVKGVPRTEAPQEKGIDVDILTPRVDQDPSSFLSQLKICNGTFSEENLWRIFTRPFALIASPVVSAAHLSIWWRIRSFTNTRPADVVHVRQPLDADGVV